ncbi:MAG TPA: transaldolase family protein [Alphaproteobacteria bacterium]|nr:transaldolase family protein [Alphaproteobacteria bacterium]
MVSASAFDPLDLTGLRLFLDTADVTVWADWLPVGIFYGVTTNPTLLQRAGVRCTVPSLRDLAMRAFDFGAAEVQLQTWGGETDALVATGRELAAIDRRVVVKVPITRAGVAAGVRLVAGGARITLTGAYAAHQALTAAAAAADYVAPYLGRMNDAGRDGHDQIVAMEEMLDQMGSPMRVLVASLRSLDDVVRLARRGVDTFTISPALAGALFDEPLTEGAVSVFEEAARAMGETAARSSGGDGA